MRVNYFYLVFLITASFRIASSSKFFSLTSSFAIPSLQIYFNYMLCVESVVHVILEDSIRRDIRPEVSATTRIIDNRKFLRHKTLQ